MSSVIFDIETLAFPLESFDETQQEYLLKFADTEEKRELEIQKMNLYALTAQVIAVAMLNPETMAGKVYFQADKQGQYYSADNKIEYLSGDEKLVLHCFWDAIQKYDQFITFNGRTFDCPFVLLRSAITGVQPTRDLLPYRYDASRHCDLLDQLSFYGATKKFNLDFYCKAFGIKSPKSEGLTGLGLGPLFREGRYKEIADYCMGDVIATAELFKRWNEFLNMKE
ncbi:MAG: ribonuclease H-like domain-containing protein [Ignavibacteriae bacterium]|nr:ribonuclease H-like domain-containing protein [Ignavibacteria bacterium]MBI3363994.1 ribonuclease H-like domain-containing protein [Ignavibacteriota bacterium]